MAKTYRVLQQDGSGWDGPWGLIRTMFAASNRVLGNREPYSLHKNGKLVKEFQFRYRVLDGLRLQLKAAGNGGDTYTVKGKFGGLLFQARVVEPPAPKLSGSWAAGNDRVDRVVEFVLPKWRVENWGIYVCKYIAGSSTHSQHAYANAVDFGGPSQLVLEQIAHALVAQEAALKLAHVIVGYMIWERGRDWYHYDGEYHAHVHVDCEPQFSGSCGYRN